jgi:hypothetical protein
MNNALAFQDKLWVNNLSNKILIILYIISIVGFVLEKHILMMQILHQQSL